MLTRRRQAWICMHAYTHTHTHTRACMKPYAQAATAPVFGHGLQRFRPDELPGDTLRTVRESRGSFSYLYCSVHQNSAPIPQASVLQPKPSGSSCPSFSETDCTLVAKRAWPVLGHGLSLVRMPLEPLGAMAM